MGDAHIVYCNTPGCAIREAHHHCDKCDWVGISAGRSGWHAQVAAAMHHHCYKQTCDLTMFHVHCTQCDYAGPLPHVHCPLCNVTNKQHTHCAQCQAVVCRTTYHKHCPLCDVTKRHKHCEQCGMTVKSGHYHQHCTQCERTDYHYHGAPDPIDAQYSGDEYSGDGDDSHGY